MDEIDWYVYGAIGLLTLCTLLTRTTYLLFGHHAPLGEGVRRALRYAPAAALTAILVPTLLPWSTQEGGTVIDEKVLAALFAIWLFKRTNNNLVMILGGMVMFWLLRLLFSVVSG
jgi:branched-subunit amino acid transport protein